MATEPDLDDEIVPTNADDTACIIYTSGTTGRPKGAELTHFGLFMGASVGGQNFGASDEDVALAVLPFFHVFGLAAVRNTNICFGGTLSVVPRFDVAAVLDAVERDRVSVVLGVPTMLQALLAQDTAGRDLSSLRVAISGGARPLDRQAAVGSRGASGRPRRRHPAPRLRPHRRARRARPRRDEGLPGSPGGDRRGLPRWLVPHR